MSPQVKHAHQRIKGRGRAGRACCVQVQEFIEEQSNQERRGPAAKSLADNDLFFVDKVSIK